MHFVLTNDDGIAAPGIAALARAAAPLGAITTVAPSTEQSGIGHRVTTGKGLRAIEVEPARFAVFGTPADCTRLALKRLAPEATWLLAGINHGGNLGVDLFPSATVAAAREAAILGFPAIAISQYIARGREVDWSATARRTRAVLDLLLVERPPEGAFWNVNLPHPEDDEADPEIVLCPPDPSPMDIRYRLQDDLHHYDGDYHGRPRRPQHDVDVCFGGRIAVSLVPICG